MAAFLYIKSSSYAVYTSHIQYPKMTAIVVCGVTSTKMILDGWLKYISNNVSFFHPLITWNNANRAYSPTYSYRLLVICAL